MGLDHLVNAVESLNHFDSPKRNVQINDLVATNATSENKLSYATKAGKYEHFDEKTGFSIQSLIGNENSGNNDSGISNRKEISAEDVYFSQLNLYGKILFINLVQKYSLETVLEILAINNFLKCSKSNFLKCSKSKPKKETIIPTESKTISKNELLKSNTKTCNDNDNLRNRPAENDNLHNRPAENDNLHNRPAENDNLHNRPVDNDNLHKRPTENDNLHNRPAENDNLHNRPVENDNLHNRPAERSKVSILTNKAFTPARPNTERTLKEPNVEDNHKINVSFMNTIKVSSLPRLIPDNRKLLETSRIDNTKIKYSSSYGNVASILVPTSALATSQSVIKINGLYRDQVKPSQSVISHTTSINVSQAVHQKKRLLQLNKQDEDGDTMLHIAVAQENVAASKSLISQMNKDGINIKNFSGQTALHLACFVNLHGVIRDLVLHGADVSVIDQQGNTAMHIACNKNLVHIVEIVLQCFLLDPDKFAKMLTIRNVEGLAPIHLATKNNNEKIVQLIIASSRNIDIQEQRSGETSLHMALRQGNFAISKLLINKRANVNIPSFSGVFPLYYAAQLKNIILVEELIDHGAELGRCQELDKLDDSIESQQIKRLLDTETRRRRRKRKKEELDDVT